MKLTRVRVTEYRSIWDSNEFTTGQVTCLVGKNEAGKTSILQALYRLNPLVETDSEFDVTDDYPRSEVEDYTQDVENKKREHAMVITATFALDPDELAAIEKEVGSAALKAPEVEVSKGYAKGGNGRCTRYVTVPVVQSAVVKNLVESFGLRDDERRSAAGATTLTQLMALLTRSATQQDQAAASARAEAEKLEDAAEKAAALEKAKTFGESEQAKALRERIAVLQKYKDLGLYLWHEILARSFPKRLGNPNVDGGFQGESCHRIAYAQFDGDGRTERALTIRLSWGQPKRPSLVVEATPSALGSSRDLLG